MYEFMDLNPFLGVHIKISTTYTDNYIINCF